MDNTANTILQETCRDRFNEICELEEKLKVESDPNKIREMKARWNQLMSL